MNACTEGSDAIWQQFETIHSIGACEFEAGVNGDVQGDERSPELEMFIKYTPEDGNKAIGILYINELQCLAENRVNFDGTPLTNGQDFWLSQVLDCGTEFNVFADPDMGTSIEAYCSCYDVSDSPTTSSPTTSSPVTEAPTTESPITQSPLTSSPTTGSPSTSSPVTDSPTTVNPTTRSPSTSSPLTNSLTTNSPITAPLTDSPTTLLQQIAASGDNAYQVTVHFVNFTVCGTASPPAALNEAALIIAIKAAIDSTYSHSVDNIDTMISNRLDEVQSCTWETDMRRLIGGLFSSIEVHVVFDEFTAFRNVRDDVRDKANPFGDDCNVLKSYFKKQISNIKLQHCEEKSKAVINRLADEESCGHLCVIGIVVVVLLFIAGVVVIVQIRKIKCNASDTVPQSTTESDAELSVSSDTTTESDEEHSESDDTEAEEARLISILQKLF